MQTLSARITFSCASPRIVVGRRALYECFYRRSCTSPVFLQPAVHFPRNAASSRALRLFSCRGSISCKEIGEVHVRRPAKRPFRRALPPFSCRRSCTSPVSLREFPPLQGFGGSARHHARKAGKCTTTHSKCTSSCKKSGEVHDHAFEVHVVVHGLWRSACPAPKARPAPEAHVNAQELDEAHSISRSV